MKAYECAQARARVLGFEYRAPVLLAQNPDLDEIVRRLEVKIKDKVRDPTPSSDFIDQPRLSVRKAMELYLDEIGVVTRRV